MDQYQLVKATINDADFFYQVKKTVLKGYIEKIWGWNEDFQLQFHKENYNFLTTYIIQSGKTSIGVVEIKEEEKRIFICSLYVLPAWQGKGIGSGIISRYINKASCAKKRVELEVLKLNVNAIRLYKRLGFEIIGEDDSKFFMFKDGKQ